MPKYSDKRNETYHLRQARKARKKKDLTTSMEAQRILAGKQKYHTKAALKLRAKQDRKGSK